tara:strand:+ start:72 stop:350 length:279 start_codon:yes stop_codon:yes gene_type:complete
MNIKAVPLEKFFKNKESIYKNIMIVSKRARQIINERYEEVAALNNIEDSDDIIEVHDQDYNQEKSISIAMDELLKNELEHRDFNDDKEDETD